MGLLRFLLACGVVIGHSDGILGYTPLAGDLAVQCFYIISGFYMALILNEKYTGKQSLYVFYTNRALKIYPLYWIVLLLRVVYAFIVLYFGYPGTLTHYAETWPLPASSLTFLIVTNVFIFGLDWYFFLGIKNDGALFFTKDGMTRNVKVYDMAFNFIAWTISLELLFYLFAPFIVRKKPTFIILILLISLIIRLVLIQNNLTEAPWNYMFFPAQIMFFMAGILAYHMYTYLLKYPIKSKITEYGILLVITLIVLFYYRFFQESYLKQIFLFISITLSIPVLFKLTKAYNWDRWLGNLSYPIYITQILFLKLLPAKSIPKVIDLGFTTLICTILLSITLDYLVTKPLERIRQSRATKLIH